jgi:hypothetical protein
MLDDDKPGRGVLDEALRYPEAREDGLGSAFHYVDRHLDGERRRWERENNYRDLLNGHDESIPRRRPPSKMVGMDPP